MNLENAVGKHAEWKLKLRQAIITKETLDIVTIEKDNCCELGKWLHGEAKTKFGKFPSYADCVSKHAAFHLEAGRVAKLIGAQKYSEAEAMLGSGSSYTVASSAVGVAILRLKKDANL